MGGNGITIKTTTQGIVLVLNEKEDFKITCKKVEDKLNSAGDFFKGARISVKYRGRSLEKHEENILKTIVENNSGAKVENLDRDESSPQAGKSPSINDGRIKLKKLMYFDGIDEGNTRFIRGTVRSGQLIRYEGNIVVIGDVNAGAEIQAAGNIVVMGALRGLVHAGCDGNRKAVITAPRLNPTQLRIADVISRPPDEAAYPESSVPEIAFVHNNVIYIDKLVSTY